VAETLVEVNDLHKHFPVESGLVDQVLGNQNYIHAVDGINLNIQKGEIYGIAGESGCGKTTTGRCLTRLETPTDGEILFGKNQTDIANLSGSKLKEYRRDCQMVFQDPFSSINSRFTVRKWVREPLIIHDIGTREERENRVIETLEQCGLRPPEEFLDEYPHELSGGQQQRVALARAMVLDPSFIVADEPTSMLDVSVRAGVLNVLERLVREENVTIFYISHDLSMLRYICDRIAIMYQGEIVEAGSVSQVLQEPKHPYTQLLRSAVPRIDPTKTRTRISVPPEVKERIGGIEGCPYKFRCQYRFEDCDTDPPDYQPDPELEQSVACHLYDEDNDQELPTGNA
jgi:peptide/nickel transport system ATP-binding protein